MMKKTLLLLPFILLVASAAQSAEWQWSIPTPDQEDALTFLWIPPECGHVRGIVIGQRNMLEEDILEDPSFRATLARLGLAEVWTVPPMDIVFRFDEGAGKRIETLLNQLAEASGYSELSTAPLIPLGHSACASYPWNLAAWNPERTLAILSVKGDAPQTDMTGSGRPNPEWGGSSIDGIPGLMVMGEYEWLEGRIDPLSDFQKKHPHACLAMLPDIGHGHFDTSKDLISFLNLFIQKAVAYRMPDGMLPLHTIDPKQGWLVQRWKLNQPRSVPPAPYTDYAGAKTNAFWAFDEETARAIDTYRTNQIGRKPQLIGFAHNGEIIKQQNIHFQVALPHDLLEADGITFHVQTAFMSQVGNGSDNLSRWTYRPAGSPLTHASTGGPIQVDRICGPVEKIAPDTFRIALDRTWAATDRRNRDIWLRAWHPGDLEHKGIVQQALMTFPENTEGKQQTLDFPAIGDVTNGIVSLPLQAASDAGLPVRFFVKDGPVEVIGNQLYFTAVPPRAKYPVSVTVYAYQLGRSSAPRVQAAPMVQRTFHILK